MSKSSNGLLGRKSGTVTVLETRVHRSTARNAKVAFVVVWLVVGLLSATVLADRMHPIPALLLGALLGAGCGAAVWAYVRIWPFIRYLWWWLPEILLGLGVVYGFTVLAQATSLPLRLAVLGLLVGIVAGIGPVRRFVWGWLLCLVVRHRLRSCFDEFIVANRSGTLPLILAARPTPVGERVWIWLRPGLSSADLLTRLDKIAVACWAKTAVVEQASDKAAAFVRIDLKRREVLTTTVGSPLVDAIDTTIPAARRDVGPVPTALDLPDVAQAPVGIFTPSSVKPRNGKPAATKPTDEKPATGVKPTGDDIDEWI